MNFVRKFFGEMTFHFHVPLKTTEFSQTIINTENLVEKASTSGRRKILAVS